MRVPTLKIVVLATVFAFAAGAAAATQITGVIVDTKDVKMRNSQQPHKVLLLKAQDGRTIVADLGPADKLQQSFEKDQRVRLEGRPARVGSRPVLLVSSGEIEGRQFQVDRLRRQQQAARDPQQMERRRQAVMAERRIKGEVTHEKTVGFENQDLEHQVVMIETEQGEPVVADLGPRENLKDIGIEKGKQLELQGHLAIVGDHLLLVANQVQADGRTIDIQRRSTQQQTGTGQQQSGAQQQPQGAAPGAQQGTQ